MKNLTWQNPEQLFVAQELINKVKSKCCGIKVNVKMAKGMRPIAISLLEEHFVLVPQAESILCHNIPQHRTQLKKTVTVYRE